MSNEALFTELAEVTVASSTATVAVADVSGTASVVTNLSSANHSNYPYGRAVLTFSGTNSISSASTLIYLYRRDINVNGTADTPELSTATNSYYMQKYVGAFVAKATSASFTTNQELTVDDIPLSKDCEFYVEDRLNIPIGGGWVLKMIPKTFVPGA